MGYVYVASPVPLIREEEKGIEDLPLLPDERCSMLFHSWKQVEAAKSSSKKSVVIPILVVVVFAARFQEP